MVQPHQADKMDMLTSVKERGKPRGGGCSLTTLAVLFPVDVEARLGRGRAFFGMHVLDVLVAAFQGVFPGAAAVDAQHGVVGLGI